MLVAKSSKGIKFDAREKPRGNLWSYRLSATCRSLSLSLSLSLLLSFSLFSLREIFLDGFLKVKANQPWIVTRDQKVECEEQRKKISDVIRFVGQFPQFRHVRPTVSTRPYFRKVCLEQGLYILRLFALAVTGEWCVFDICNWLTYKYGIRG